MAVPGFTVDVPNKRRLYVRPDKVRLQIVGARLALRGRQPQSRHRVRNPSSLCHCVRLFFLNHLDALPLLDKDEPQVILDIDMTMMPQTPRLSAQPRVVTPGLIRGRRRERSCGRDAPGWE